jgi:lysophospholipase
MLSCILHRLYLSALILSGVVYAFNGSVADYAPLVNQPCPNITTNPLVRSFTPKNQTLHPREASYVDTRLSTVIPNEWQNWIGDGSTIGYNLSQLIVNVNSTIATPGNGSFPKIGIAISGGGYRAAQYGAGVLSALDARNDSAKTAGTGGFLQVTSYLSGLSGALQSQSQISQVSLFFAPFPYCE